MSINDILSSARTGLVAAQAALGTVSNNVSNVGTVGYAREKINLTTQVVSGRVVGVTVGEPTRVADRFLEDTVYRRGGDMGRYRAEADYLDRLQALLGQPGAEGGIPARVDAINASAIAMSGLSNSPESVATFIGNVQDTVDSLQQLQQDASLLKGDVETEVSFTVDRINGLLERIHDLNGTITRLEGLGRSVSGAADNRMQAIEELSTLIQVNVRHQPDGRITLDTADGSILLDRRLRQLSYPMPGEGASQSSYPPISIHFADDTGVMGADTGEKLGGASSGGTLGGLINLRDNIIPQFADKLGVLFGGLAETLNSASNTATAMPPPTQLTGRPTGLVGADRLGFTGTAQFAVTDKAGKLLATTTVDFDALGAGATVNDAINAINAGLGGNATASIDATGTLTFKTNVANSGVAIAQGSPNPSSRAGIGFSHFFGLNDVIVSDHSTLTPSGLNATDPHGFAVGQSAQVELRDTTGRLLASHSLTGSVGSTMGDLVTELNASPIAQYGSFAIDPNGRFSFTPITSLAGANVAIPTDSTNRLGTGRTFTALSGLTGGWSDLQGGKVRPDLVADPSHMPMATLQSGIAIGFKALGSGDISGAGRIVDAMNAAQEFAGNGNATVARFTANLMGGLGTTAALAEDRFKDSEARKTDATNRRDSFSGVNLDEELGQMVVLQNSYSAAARVMTTATQMYDTLIEMMR